jgi:radical SAM superfamily enzyme YgiQ (UPF0313 family)
MKITLLHPSTDHVLQSHRHQTGHLGLGYIAACLLERGHEVRVLDAKNQWMTDEDIRRHIREFQPHIFGATAMTHEIHSAAEGCSLAKQVNPDILTIVGGPHASALPERTLQEFPSIDVAAMGEGEETLCELTAMMQAGGAPAELGDVPGIVFRSRDGVKRTRVRPWCEDLDKLPFPAWRLFPKVFWPIFSSRGCPFGCVFCQRVMGRQVRQRSVDSVMAELDALEDQLGQTGIWFQDETFGINKRWADEFLTKMTARNQRKGVIRHWGGNSRANLADVSLYQRMREAGCNSLSFGIESGNPRILKRIQKGITREMAVKAIAAAKEAGIPTAAFFILGHPGETLRTALQTVHFAAKCRSDSIAVGVMVPYPGTEVWNMARAGEYGYQLLSEDWRVYDKYFGNALAVRGLSHRRLEFLQALTYVWFYIYNLRIRKLATFVFRFRLEAWTMVKRFLLPKPA